MPTDKKIIEEYNKHAKAYANRQRDGSNIYHIYLEKPAIYSLLPSLEGKSILCVGCGSGEELEYLSSLGTKRIVGIDISEKLIEIAKSSYPKFEFQVMDIENLVFPKESFDLVFSSLTMHYLESWLKALKSINNVLKKNGNFVFSITHPFFSATQKKEDKQIKTRILGYKDTKNTSEVEIFGNYLDSYKLDAYVSKELTVTNYHWPLSVIFKEIINSGFEILDILEPKAQSQSKERYAKFWKIHQKIPEFMVFKIRKRQ